MPSRDEALRLLSEHKRTLSERFGVLDVALFGSAARDEATEDSDVDVLAWFDADAEKRRPYEAQSYLEDVFGCKVDLVDDRNLRTEFRPYVEEDILRGPQSRSGWRRDWKIYVRDMIGFCEDVLEFSDGMERAAFFADKLSRDATLFCIRRIGYFATRVPQEIRDANPHIPWGYIIGARDRIHGYDLRHINEDAVWEIVQSGVPNLLPKLRELAEGE